MHNDWKGKHKYFIIHRQHNCVFYKTLWNPWKNPLELICEFSKATALAASQYKEMIISLPISKQQLKTVLLK